MWIIIIIIIFVVVVVVVCSLREVGDLRGRIISRKVVEVHINPCRIDLTRLVWMHRCKAAVRWHYQHPILPNSLNLGTFLPDISGCRRSSETLPAGLCSLSEAY